MFNTSKEVARLISQGYCCSQIMLQTFDKCRELLFEIGLLI